MSIYSFTFLMLVLFQVKHWYIDFVNQTADEVDHKGIYGNWLGIKHSLKQGIGTYIILIPFTTLTYAVVFAAFDFVIHYHVDWIKMKFGERDISTPAFWNQLGFDQMMHQITYGFIIITTTFTLWHNI